MRADMHVSWVGDASTGRVSETAAYLGCSTESDGLTFLPLVLNNILFGAFEDDLTLGLASLIKS